MNTKIKLKELKINKYPNVVPNKKLVFNDKFNVLIGGNGSGKTTLLKLVAEIFSKDFNLSKVTDYDIKFKFNCEDRYFVSYFINNFDDVFYSSELIPKYIEDFCKQSTKVKNEFFNLRRFDHLIYFNCDNIENLSYGQKSFLSFLWYLNKNKDIIIADEPFNGINHEWIESLLNQINGQQVFFTTQNPFLLDQLRFNSVEEVMSCFIECACVNYKSKRCMSWQNMDEQSADSFYRSYITGVQSVSEILRTKGLW